MQETGYGRGLAVLNYADEDLPAAVKAGELTQEQADYAKENRGKIDNLLRDGMNVGKVADNLVESAHAHGLIEKVPFVGPKLARFNTWLFGEFQRGAMVQAGVVAYDRNKARFPELSDEQISRRTAREMNEFFGSLGNQGVFKNKTLQDASRLVLLAPQWAESQFRSEVRGIGQAARVPVDVIRGKGFRVGVVAQAMAGGIVAALVANQVLNLFTRGQLPFPLPERG